MPFLLLPARLPNVLPKKNFPYLQRISRHWEICCKLLLSNRHHVKIINAVELLRRLHYIFSVSLFKIKTYIIAHDQCKKVRFISGLSNGDDGIRTHVPGNSDKLISSQSRYGLFGTSPYTINVLFPERLLLYYITFIFSNIFYHKIYKSSLFVTIHATVSHTFSQYQK